MYITWGQKYCVGGNIKDFGGKIIQGEGTELAKNHHILERKYLKILNSSEYSTQIPSVTFPQHDKIQHDWKINSNILKMP